MRARVVHDLCHGVEHLHAGRCVEPARSGQTLRSGRESRACRVARGQRHGAGIFGTAATATATCGTADPQLNGVEGFYLTRLGQACFAPWICQASTTQVRCGGGLGLGPRKLNIQVAEIHVTGDKATALMGGIA